MSPRESLALLTDQELLQRAREAGDAELRHQCVMELHLRRRADEVAAIARQLLLQGPVEDRVLLCDVLAQLDYSDHPEDRARTVELLTSFLRPDVDPILTEASAIAFSHLGPHLAFDSLAGVAESTSAGVRRGVAIALGRLEDERGKPVLFRLARDDDAGVRDWAVFGLAGSDLDGGDVRDVLADALRDECGEVRDEAIGGLARRGDARARDALLAELRSGNVSAPLLEAAEQLLDDEIGQLLLPFSAEAPNGRALEAHLRDQIHLLLRRCASSRSAP